MKETIREVAEDTQGFSKRGAPDWFSENEEEIRSLITSKNVAHAATLNRRVTRRI